MPTIKLCEMSRDDVVPVINLAVHKDQDRFIASNAISLAQAPYETGCYVYALRANDTVVGFCALLDNREHAFLDKDDHPEAAYLWRMMIDHAHQQNGYGRAALTAIVAWSKARGLSAVVLTVLEENIVPRRMYSEFGFIETGRCFDGEVEMQLDLT